MNRFVALLFLACAAHSASAAPVTLNFTNTGRQAGVIQVAVFNDARFFPDNKAGVVKKASVRVTNAQTTAQIKLDLPDGDYAMSVILDENGNETLDTNFMGIPKERFGFSNNPAVRFGPPRYSQCEVRVEPAGSAFSINFKKML